MGRSQSIRVSVMVAAWLVASAAPAWAQLSGLTGAARDATGAVLPGVTVEASSPALIEKVRVAVTDGQGRYTIVDVTPGTYRVSFTLPGFSQFVREGIQLSAGFTATIDAEMRVGALEETVTVSGASPLVDVQNARAQSVLAREVLDAVPLGKGYSGIQTMTVGAISNLVNPTGGRDVGGTRGDSYSGALEVHGTADGKLTLDGKTTSFRGTRMTLFHINPLSIQEVVIDTGGNTAETQYGGSSVRVITKDGGNTFSGQIRADWAPPAMQSDNLNAEAISRGLREANQIKKLYDVGAAFGGPIAQDKLWFYTSHRLSESQEYLAGIYFNKLQHQVPAFWEPDLDRQAFSQAYDRDNQVKFTWQPGEKHKYAFQYVNQRNCGCYFGMSAARAPEATFGHYFEGPLGGQHMINVRWTYPATNRLLFETLAGLWIVDNNLPAPEGVEDNDIAVWDLGLGLQYGQLFSANPLAANPGWVNTQGDKGDQGDSSQEFKVSYVTGSHSFKFGFQSTQQRYNEASTGPRYSPAIMHIYLNRVPVQIAQMASPSYYNLRMVDYGFFAQDTWTMDRLSVSYGMRFDATTSFSPAFTRPGGYFLGEVDYPAMSRFSDFKDIVPRLGAAYDLFGTARTALKFNLGQNMTNEGLSRALASHPAIALQDQANRTWNDVNRNYVPDCDYRNPLPNGECGQLSGLAFGTQLPVTVYADEAKWGWGNRDHTWTMSAAVQHQLASMVGLTFGYYRTWYGNILTTDNLAVTRADFTEYCVTMPTDSRLPGGGGNQVCGLYDVSPAKFGQFNNVVTLSDRAQVYNGFDVLINARFDNGATIQGGFNTGETIIDNCATPDAPAQFCRSASPPWKGQHNLKLAGQYPLPWYGLVMSATFLNLPGIAQNATTSISNAQIRPSLGRDLAACRGAAVCNARVNALIYPNNSEFEARQTQVDWRIGANIRAGNLRVQPRFEIYNLFNAADVQALNGTFTPGATNPWLRAAQILTARLFKFAVQIDY
ncbi:MAG: TonB-dependent receptor [Acidimicrobiia bacterium]|nr:TonB-dependent receptor [Acidimicrobiia bacterium]